VSGFPIMGHIGMTPHFIICFGCFKVQCRTDEAAKHLLEEAKLLDQAGCFGIFLECIPANIAKYITQNLDIPTIGIGA
ncbi:3-methyl-2-oxobutanoate hydroxymethyltransferase, partial [Francisella tularensis]|uniref:3-methyl-2-oxobutanoate hydroxymethyltransferase n=1 Tax=Francisella tularensis TaxID=263 RepID=UPI002381BCC1